MKLLQVTQRLEPKGRQFHQGGRLDVHVSQAWESRKPWKSFDRTTL
jgi:hypothetical protein